MFMIQTESVPNFVHYARDRTGARQDRLCTAHHTHLGSTPTLGKVDVICFSIGRLQRDYTLIVPGFDRVADSLWIWMRGINHVRDYAVRPAGRCRLVDEAVPFSPRLGGSSRC